MLMFALMYRGGGGCSSGVYILQLGRMISSVPYCILCKQTGGTERIWTLQGRCVPLPDVSNHLVTSTQALRSMCLELLYYGGAVPARTIPPEGGLKSWANEKAQRAAGWEWYPRAWGKKIEIKEFGF